MEKLIELNAANIHDEHICRAIFSLFYEGKFVATDLSVCMDSLFDKIMAKQL